MKKKKGWKKAKKAKKAAKRTPLTSKQISRKTTQKLRAMAKKVRRSKDMKILKEKQLSIDPECAQCGSTCKLEVHHAEFLHHLLRRLNITSDNKLARAYDEVYDLGNMVTLCHSCHAKLHSQPGINR